MEASILNEIVNGNTAVMAVLFLFLFKAHKQAMDKLDKLTDTMAKLVTSNEIHANELEHGDKRFIAIEDEVKRMRENQHAFRDTLHYVKNKMITQEHLKTFMEK